MRAIVFALVALLACTAVSAEETCLDLANKLQVRAGGRGVAWRRACVRAEIGRTSVCCVVAVPLRLRRPCCPIVGLNGSIPSVDGPAHARARLWERGAGVHWPRLRQRQAALRRRSCARAFSPIAPPAPLLMGGPWRQCARQLPSNPPSTMEQDHAASIVGAPLFHIGVEGWP